MTGRCIAFGMILSVVMLFHPQSARAETNPTAESLLIEAIELIRSGRSGALEKAEDKLSKALRKKSSKRLEAAIYGQKALIRATKGKLSEAVYELYVGLGVDEYLKVAAKSELPRLLKCARRFRAAHQNELRVKMLLEQVTKQSPWKCPDPSEAIKYRDVEVCHDDIDNDGDSKIDCRDSDCSEDQVCKTGTQSPGNSEISIEPPQSHKVIVEICNDNIDNDGNGHTDCFDSMCHQFPGCKEIGDDRGRDSKQASVWNRLHWSFWASSGGAIASAAVGTGAGVIALQRGQGMVGSSDVETPAMVATGAFISAGVMAVIAIISGVAFTEPVENGM